MPLLPKKITRRLKKITLNKPLHSVVILSELPKKSKLKKSSQKQRLIQFILFHLVFLGGGGVKYHFLMIFTIQQ